MHPRVQELIEHLDSSHRGLLQAIEDVPAAGRERRPGPDRWSVAEILQHLALIEGGLARILGEALESARAAGLGPERDTSPVIDPEEMRMLLDRTRRFPAPGPAHPKPGVTAAEALAAFESSHRRLRAVLLSGDGLALGEVVHVHPAFGPLTFYKWFAFTGGHETRHTAQMREVARVLKGAEGC
ncbi:MAG: hypothetical protein A3H96_22465 [Acidobacteria bacterium RIFCSPLOWO2_02_FULL_67_36]|nr:MAG: hypothetical protein A3H96_22465 [Acidobacteria bacterium RIFCSPLOWO2_02_FULL_67_36]